MARWLDDDEQATWRAFIAAVDGLDDALDRQLQRDAGMPHSYYRLLVHLSEAPGRAMRMTDLADMAGSSPSRLSHAAARLEQEGWLRREACATDRRGSVATLTDAGYAALQAAAPGHVATVRRLLFDRMSATDRRALRRICESLLDGLDKG